MNPGGSMLVKAVLGNSTSGLLSPAWASMRHSRPCDNSNVAFVVLNGPPLILVVTRLLLHLLLRGRIQLPAKEKLSRNPISDTSVFDCKLVSHPPLAVEWQFLWGRGAGQECNYHLE